MRLAWEETAIARVTSFDVHEREGGTCPQCRTPARLFVCWQCCEASWIIACAHRPGVPPMRRGRRDGSDRHRVFCVDCAAPV